MRELTDIGYLRELLNKYGTRTKKGLGQNFLVNPSVCPRMAAACGADKESGVLEIGCGVGVLTRELSKVAGKVVCVEIDGSLFPLLGETLADCENVELVQGSGYTLRYTYGWPSVLDAPENEGDLPTGVWADIPANSATYFMVQ